MEYIQQYCHLHIHVSAALPIIMMISWEQLFSFLPLLQIYKIRLLPFLSAICFKQASLSILYTFIIDSLRHYNESLLRSLFLLFTALVLLGHACHWSIIIIEKDLLSFVTILKTSHDLSLSSNVNDIYAFQK